MNTINKICLTIFILCIVLGTTLSILAIWDVLITDNILFRSISTLGVIFFGSLMVAIVNKIIPYRGNGVINDWQLIFRWNIFFYICKLQYSVYFRESQKNGRVRCYFWLVISYLKNDKIFKIFLISDLIRSNIRLSYSSDFRAGSSAVVAPAF